MMRADVLVVAIVAGSVALRAQTSVTTTARPAFEVVSIKRPDPARRLPRGIIMPFVYRPGGRRLEAAQVNTFSLLQTAFGTRDRVLHSAQIVGAPAWTKTDMYAIDVTTSNDVRQSGSEFGLMVRSLLEDRFALKAHIEARPFPVYALVVTKPSAFGPQLRASTVDCTEEARKEQEALDRDRSAVIAAALSSTDRPVCSTRFLRGGGGLTAGAILMRTLAENLNNSSVALDRLVVDKTGMAGRFDVDLHWAVPVAGGAANTATLSDGPSIFAALQEQLGLKLERSEEPLDVLVIDHIEPPTPN